jgi:hypothetical protein
VYSPRIREALVPFIYRAAKDRKVPMTVWVNEALAKALELHVSPETGDAVRHPEEQPLEQKETP